MLLHVHDTYSAREFKKYSRFKAEEVTAILNFRTNQLKTPSKNIFNMSVFKIVHVQYMIPLNLKGKKGEKTCRNNLFSKIFTHVVFEPTTPFG